VGVNVNAIRPTNVMPHDYDRFWNHGKAELLRVEMDPKLEPAHFDGVPGKHYLISLGNIDGARVKGKLVVPDGEGPFPAVLWVPYAGVYQVDDHGIYADSGFVVLSIDAHGIDQDKPREWYRALADGPLYDYRTFGFDDKYEFYFRRTILGAIRAIDYLCSRSDVDSAKIAITGGSQGGALSLLVGGLDQRIKAVAAGVPAMCDHTGALYGRPSGWPQLIKHVDPAKMIPTTGYFDGALNAGRITAPTLIGVGFIDPVCPPTTVYAAYNNLAGEKEIDNFTQLAHHERKGWVPYKITWLKKKLNVR
jgi:cephalosporin-C deacetylase-like acetyl esterase